MEFARLVLAASGNELRLRPELRMGRRRRLDRRHRGERQRALSGNVRAALAPAATPSATSLQRPRPRVRGRAPQLAKPWDS